MQAVLLAEVQRSVDTLRETNGNGKLQTLPETEEGALQCI